MAFTGLRFGQALDYAATKGFRFKRKDADEAYEVCNDRGNLFFQKVNAKNGDVLEFTGFNNFDMLEVSDWEVYRP